MSSDDWRCLSTGSRGGEDDTVVQMMSDVTESVLRDRSIGDDTRTYHTEISMEQPSLNASDIGQSVAAFRHEFNT